MSMPKINILEYTKLNTDNSRTPRSCDDAPPWAETKRPTGLHYQAKARQARNQSSARRVPGASPSTKRDIHGIDCQTLTSHY